MSDLMAIIKELAGFYKNNILNKNYDYIVPVEGKGTLFLDLISKEIEAKQNILYKRGFDFVSSNVLKDKRAALIDDTIFYGRTLSELEKTLNNQGLKKTDKYALINIISQNTLKQRDMEFFKHIYSCKSINANIDYSNILYEIKEVTLNYRVPYAQDHLVFKVENFSDEDWKNVYKKLYEKGTLLEYGNRGSYESFTYFLPFDLSKKYNHQLACPPKIRIWKKKDTNVLTLVPMVFPSISFPFKKNQKIKYWDRFSELIKSKNKKLDIYDIVSMSLRTELLNSFLNIFHYNQKLYDQFKNVKLEPEHILKYYGSKTGIKLVNEIERVMMEPVDNREFTQSPEISFEHIYSYFAVAWKIMKQLKEKYEKQAILGIPRSKWESKGFTINEIIDNFYSQEDIHKIHCAIDYLCDYGYAVPFLRKKPEGASLAKTKILERALRLSEGGENMFAMSPVDQMLTISIFSSKDRKLKYGEMEKIVPILENFFDIKIEGFTSARVRQLVTSKPGQYGNITTTKTFQSKSEVKERLLKDYALVNEKCPIKREKGYYELEAKPDDKSIQDTKQILLRNREIKSFSPQIRAIVDLNHNKESLAFTQKGQFLAHSLMGRNFSGMKNLAHNLISIFNYGEDSYSCNKDGRTAEAKKAWKMVKQHQAGFNEKYNILKSGKVEKYIDFLKDQTISPIEWEKEDLIRNTYFIGKDFYFYDLLKGIFDNYYGLLENIKDTVISGTSLENKIDEYYKLAREINPSIDKFLMSPKNFLSVLEKNIIYWNWALSGEPLEDYRYFYPNPKPNEEKFVVFADAVKSEEGSLEWQNALKGVISNWFLRFNGQVNPDKGASGDRALGLFNNLEDALNASILASYHLDSLNKAHMYDFYNKAAKPFLAVFGIGKDRVNLDNYGEIRSDNLNIVAKTIKKVVGDLSDMRDKPQLKCSVKLLKQNYIDNIIVKDKVVKNLNGHEYYSFDSPEIRQRVSSFIQSFLQRLDSITIE